MKTSDGNKYSKKGTLLTHEDEKYSIELLSKLKPQILLLIKDKGLYFQKDDILQDIYLAILKTPKSRNIIDPRAYIFVTARNIINRACKKNALRASIDAPISSEHFERCQEALSDNPILNAQLEQEKQKQIEDILDASQLHLSPTQTLIIELFFKDGKSTKEVAAKLKMSEDNVRAIKSRAIKTLRNLFC